MTKKKNLRSLKKEELKKLLIDWKEPGFRANQIYDWLWAKGVSSIDEMRNIPKHLSSRLKEFFLLNL
jgi:23S rRNA (adenine2503-C2)-methyltransferase